MTGTLRCRRSSRQKLVLCSTLSFLQNSRDAVDRLSRCGRSTDRSRRRRQLDAAAGVALLRHRRDPPSTRHRAARLQRRPMCWWQGRWGAALNIDLSVRHRRTLSLSFASRDRSRHFLIGVDVTTMVVRRQLCVQRSLFRSDRSNRSAPPTLLQYMFRPENIDDSSLCTMTNQREQASRTSMVWKDDRPTPWTNPPGRNLLLCLLRYVLARWRASVHYSFVWR